MIFKDMEEVRRHLRIGVPLSCYFIGGADDQRKRTILNKIVSMTTEGGSGFDNHRFSGNVSADTVADAAFEITFGGGRRCVVCEDLPFGSMGENEYKKFEQLISEVSEMGGSTVLVFFFAATDTEAKKDSKKPESKTGKIKNLCIRSRTGHKVDIRLGNNSGSFIFSNFSCFVHKKCGIVSAAFHHICAKVAVDAAFIF